MKQKKRIIRTVHAIILTVNGYHLLAKSIRSLKKAWPSGLSITVFDNGSTEPIGKLVRRDFPDVEVLRSPANLGFAEGNNITIRHIIGKRKPDAFLLFNNDAVADRKLFTVCLPYLSQGYAMVTPTVMLDGNRGVDNAGIDYFRSGFAQAHLVPEHPARLANGCCLFMETGFILEILDRYGWVFNPLFGSYAEDLDLGLRTLLTGNRQLVLPDPLVLHRQSWTYGEQNPYKVFLSWRNLLWVIITTWPGHVILQNLWWIFWGQAIAVALFTWDGKPFLYPHIYLSTAKHLPELLKTRREFQRTVRHPHAMDGIFGGNIAYWPDFLKERKLLRIGRAVKRIFRLR